MDGEAWTQRVHRGSNVGSNVVCVNEVLVQLDQLRVRCFDSQSGLGLGSCD